MGLLCALFLQGCLAVRLILGVPVVEALPGFNGVEIWYWLPPHLGGDPREAPYSFTSERDEHLRPCNLKELLTDHGKVDGQRWQNYPVIQFWCTSPEDTEKALVDNPDVEIPHLGGAGSPGAPLDDMPWTNDMASKP